MKNIFYTYYLNYEVGINYFLDSNKGIVKNFERITNNPKFMLSDIDYLIGVGPNIDELNYDYSKTKEEYINKKFDDMESKMVKKEYYVCLRHYGSYDNIKDTYDKLFEHIKNSNKKICGIPMEQYVDGSWNKEDEKDYLTIVMIPISIDIEMIVVNDSKRVSEKLNKELIENDDLILKDYDFSCKYMEYFDTKSLIKLRDFYKETGLKLDHIFIDKFNEEVRLTENGYNLEYNYPYNLVTNSHITVVSYVDSIKIKDKKLYINDKLISDLYLKGSFNFDRTIDNMVKLSLMPLNRQKEYVMNTYHPKNNLNCVKQIYLSPFSDYYFLKENGDLVLENEVYDKNVETIWIRDSIRSYIIYKDNGIVSLTGNESSKNYKRYKKIKYGETFLALLKDDGRLIMFIKQNEMPDTTIYQNIEGVDDIDFIINEDEDLYKEELILKYGNKEIKIYPGAIIIDTSTICDQDVC